tara:strand:- start:1004 stop:3097 length:2094 start_codon:yes stop_codon:yes gene_type:complete
MQKLQLYIDTTPTASNPTYLRVDLFKDETVSINLSIQDIKEPDKIFTEFTKTFTIPASKSNNLVFEHYYNADIIDGFDARNKREAKIELNNIPYKDGFIALNGVELKNNKAYSYKITFYGKTINLNKQFRDESLSALNGTLANNNIIYNAANIKAKMQVAVPTSTIIAPLITHTTQAYYDGTLTTDGNLSPQAGKGLLFDQLKYAINVNAIITAIKSQYNLDISTDFFNNTSIDQFNNLYMWLNAKKGEVEPSQEIVSYTNPVTGFTGSGTETKMSQTQTLSILAPNNNIVSSSINIVNVSNSAEFSVQISDGNGPIFTSALASGDRGFNQTNYGTLETGLYTISFIGGTAFTVGSIIWEINGSPPPPQQIGWTNTWTSTNYNFTTSFLFEIGLQMPPIKLIDFMNGLFKMFNLTAYFDNQPLLVNGNTNTNFGKIRVQTLESYYDNNFNTWDISKYIDTNNATVNVALPYNSITFSYEGLQSFYAAQFKQTTSSSWGGIRYEGQGESQLSSFTAPNNSYNVTAPFEHLQYVRLYNGSSILNLMTGWFANDNKESMVGKPLLFYAIKQASATTIRIKDVANGSSFSDLNDYIIPSNSVSLVASTSKENINFNAETNEYTGTSDFSDTLFKKFYNTYIGNVFNSRRRLYKFKAFLPLNMIYKIQMNDRITINNQSYNINNANINLITGETKLELLNRI